MKILILHPSIETVKTWAEPMRAEGMGVLFAKSKEDAARILAFHPQGVDYVVSAESAQAWARTLHLKSLTVPDQAPVSEVFRVIREGSVESFPSVSTAVAEPQTGSISLEKFTDTLTRPDPRTESQAGQRTITFERPTLFLGGSSAQSPIQAHHIAEIRESAAPVSLEELTHEPLGGGQSSPAVETIDLPDAGQETRILDESARIEFLRDKFSSEFEAPIFSQTAAKVEFEPTYREPPRFKGEVENSDLKTYLELREQDVAVLQGQVRSLDDQRKALEERVRFEQVRNLELEQLIRTQDQKIKFFEQEKKIEFESIEAQLRDYESKFKEKSEKLRSLEVRLRVSSEEVDRIKERVRVDVRKIRVREKELEAQLEILRKDSAALLNARDEKIMELKRKLDLLEFNMELAQEQIQKEKLQSEHLRHRLKEAASAMRQAEGLLDQDAG